MSMRTRAPNGGWIIDGFANAIQQTLRTVNDPCGASGARAVEPHAVGARQMAADHDERTARRGAAAADARPVGLAVVGERRRGSVVKGLLKHARLLCPSLGLLRMDGTAEEMQRDARRGQVLKGRATERAC